MGHHIPKDNVLLLQNFINNPSSLFEHKIFTTLSLLMKNITEHLRHHDYRTYYYSIPDQLFSGSGINASVHNFLDDHGEVEDIEIDDLYAEDLVASGRDLDSTAFYIGRIFFTIICVLTATWFLNKKLLRNRLIQYATELVTCHLIILPGLPFVAAFFAAIAVMRWAIWCHIQLFHRGKRHLVRPEDGFWAYEEYASSSACVCVYVIKGHCEPEKIREKVKQVVSHPVVQGKMMRRMIDFWGFAIWEEVDPATWNVRDHVKIAKWPKSDKRSKDGDSFQWSDKDVLEYCTTFQDIPMSRKRASWETVIVPNVKYDGSDEQHYACIFRMHHAIMDGISSANILHEILADKPFKFTMDPVASNGSKQPSYFVKVCMYLMALFLLPRTGLVQGLLNLDNMYNKYFLPGKTLKGPKHFVWSRPLKMDAIKKIKDTSKTSVMTVLLSSLGGSYRTVEEAKISSRKGKGGPKKIPEYYHALAPIAMLPYPDRHPRNGFSGVTLPVAVGQYESALDRLQANHKEFKKLNIGMMDVLGMFLLINMVGLMPTKLQKIFGGGAHFKMSLSNIPGSDEEIRIFGGDAITDMGAWLPCKFNLGMAMGLFSYGGRCRATMVGDETYLSKSDVESLKRNFETELLNLGKSLGMTEEDIFVEN